MIINILEFLGGLTVFILGLKLIGSIERVLDSTINNWMKRMTANRFLGCGFGAMTTAIAQSSVATNIIAISFVNAGAFTLFGACSIVIGTNIGTTMTAQLVSLKFVGGFDVTSLGSLIAFCGLLIGMLKGDKIKVVGDVMLGFGLLFIGINIISETINKFKTYEWFTNFFLIKSNVVLLLNGFFITAICQSSSVVTGMLVILASGGVIDFMSGAFLIMGANIGTCVSVVIVASKKSLVSRQVAWFNVIFNVFGSVLFFILFCCFRDQISTFFALTSSLASRRLANFHTLFNLIIGAIVLFFLKPFVKLTEFIVGTNKPTNKRKTAKVNGAFNKKT